MKRMRKAELQKILAKYMEDKRLIQQKMAQINGTHMYSDDYKKEQVTELERLIEHRLDETRKQVSKLISEKKAELDEPTDKEMDLEYQTRLANVLKILELSGKDMEQKDIEVMIEPFKDDYTAIRGIKGALSKAGRENIEFIRPDTRSETIRLLDNIDRHMYEGVGGYSNQLLEAFPDLGLGIALDKLDDDLNYVG